ncbi:MAG: HD-GYP domain-containing protein [Gemmatimonadaceae bacterium]
MKASTFIRVVCLLAIGAAVALWVYAPPNADWTIRTVITLAAFALTAELMAFLLPRGASGSIAFIPYMTAVLLVPNFAALAAIPAARLIGEGARRKDPKKTLFNIAQLTLAYSVAIIVYRWLGGKSLFELQNLSVAEGTVVAGPAMLAAYFTTVVLNTLLVSCIIAITSGERTLHVWHENNRATIGLDILAAPLVFTFAWAYANYGPMVAAIMWLPFLGLRQMNTINLELAQTNRELLELMVKSIEARDPYTSGHSRRVKDYAIHIARLMGLSVTEVEKIGTAALLHDVGKIFDKYAPILAKEERLTPEEWAVIKEHPADGATLIATMTTLRQLVPAVRHHHENWDGTGYPDGLRGEAIPLASRVIMFADTFDAMTTKRPYRGPLGEEAVRAELIRCRGRQFDPEITDRLLENNFWQSLFPPTNRSTARNSLMSLMASGVKG